MNFCILIELSKKKISFLYNRSDGESKFTPFVGDGSALPLAVYCFGNDIQIGQFAVDEAMNHNPNAYTDVFQTMKTVGTYKYKGNEEHYSTLLKYAIEKYLSNFFDTTLFGQYGRLEQNISSMPLCFVFNSDLDENDRLFVKGCFEQGGYSNLATIDYDQIVVEASSFTSAYAVCVTSDGADLYMSLYKTKTHKYLGSVVMLNKGKDPRMETAVMKLWESLGYENYYLNFEKERPILTKLAEEFLSSGELELQENVLFSDGHSRECFLSIRELNDYRYKDDGKIVGDLKNLLQKQNISPLDCTVVLKGKAANNGYFKHVFDGEFNSLMDVNDSFHTQVLSQLLQDIKEADYKFTDSVVSTSGKRIPSKEGTFPLAPVQAEKPAAVVTPVLKREIRCRIADVKGKIRIKNYEEAKSMAEELLNYLHDQNIDAWDNEIGSIVKGIPTSCLKTSTGTVATNASSVEKSSPSSGAASSVISGEDPKKYQREVRTQIAEAKAKIRQGDHKTANSALSSLLKSMNVKGIHDFDQKINEALSMIPSTSTKTFGKDDSVEKKNVSEAEKFLKSSSFADAKRAFAAEGNSDMAQVCSSLIRAQRNVNTYAGAIDSVARSHNKQSKITAVKELTASAALYRKYGVGTDDIEQLIQKYQSIN